jgi:1,2-phenylacetyl-CoA epoxidase catalytic subunit
VTRSPRPAPPRSGGEVHDLDPQEFLEEVHSFDFWFQAVDGYLSGLSYGHRPELCEVERTAAERDRLITVLCNYAVGETAALEGASGLIAIAPNRITKIFLATQVADEGRHLEVFLRRMRDLGVADPDAEAERRASRSLVLFKRRLLELVAGKDWEAAIFAQNVILEALEFAVFHSHAQDTDPITAEVLKGVIKDERRHIGFGENELGRRLKTSPHIRARMGQVKKELDHLVLDLLEETVRNIGLPASEEHRLGRTYLESVERLGFTP